MLFPRTVLRLSIVSILVTFISMVSYAYEVVKPEEVDAGMPYEVKQIPVTNPDSLSGIRIALVAAHGFEEVEATYPLEFLQARGAIVDVITPDWIKDRVMAVRFLKPSVWIPVTRQISQANPKDYDAVVIPGGAWNPIIMRTDGAVLEFVRQASAAGVLIASVCHGPQVLINAGLVKGRDITGVGDIRGDLRNAGAHVIEDRAVVVDQNLLTSRDPHDLADFCAAMEQWLTSKRAFADLHREHVITGEKLDRQMTVVCPHCHGTGKLHGGPGYYPYVCPTCHGSGQIASSKPPVSTDH